jgi:hypothetical protein
MHTHGQVDQIYGNVTKSSLQLPRCGFSRDFKTKHLTQWLHFPACFAVTPPGLFCWPIFAPVAPVSGKNSLFRNSGGNREPGRCGRGDRKVTPYGRIDARPSALQSARTVSELSDSLQAFVSYLQTHLNEVSNI